MFVEYSAVLVSPISLVPAACAEMISVIFSSHAASSRVGSFALAHEYEEHLTCLSRFYPDSPNEAADA